MHAYIGISLHESRVPHGAVPQFSLPDFVLQYCNDMKTRYLQQSILPDSDWPPSLGGQYIRLALIEQQRSLHYHTPESVIEQQKDYTRGDYDKIMERKTKIELINAFAKMIDKGGNELVLRMLVDGAPGVGKTTLSRKVSSMWANGEILQRYWLVLLLHLREKAISKAKTIDTFFYHSDSKVQESVIEFVNKRSGDGVLIIFDGFDELSSYERSEESLFLDICGGKVLPRCAIAITSRPYASRSLQELPSINRHIEVLGFTDEQVEVCIMNKIKDEEKAKELCTELKDRLDIASICQIPLNCSIVLYVYEQEKYSLPRTLTELYELFILHSLKRFLKRTKHTDLSKLLRSLEKVPHPFKENLLTLCNIAFKGLKDDKLVFVREELVNFYSLEYQELDLDLPVLDLMTSAKCFDDRGAQDTYSFLHLTIQEFLAAYWIAHSFSDNDKLEFFRQNVMNNRFRMVLLFVSGLSKLEFPNVSTVFSQQSWEEDKYLICHFTYEAGNNSLCEIICKNCCINRTINLNTTSSRFNRLVVLNFVAYGKCPWKCIELGPGDITIVHKVFSSSGLPNDTSIEKVAVFFRGSSIQLELPLLGYLDVLPHIKMVHVHFDFEISVYCGHDNLMTGLRNTFVGPQAVHSNKYAIELEQLSNATDNRSEIILQFCSALTVCLPHNAPITKVILRSVLPRDVMCILKGKLHLEHLECRKQRRQLYAREDDTVYFAAFCTTLASFISNNASLRKLILYVYSHTEIESIGLTTIQSGLKHNKTLQELILIPKTCFFQRNNKSGKMELVCSPKFGQHLSCSFVALPCRKRKQSKSPSLGEESPLLKQVHEDSSPPSISDTDTSYHSNQTQAYQQTINAESLSPLSQCQSQEFRQGPAFECTSSSVPYPMRPGFGTTGHQSNSSRSNATSREQSLSPFDPSMIKSPLAVSSQHRALEQPQSSTLEHGSTRASQVSHPTSPYFSISVGHHSDVMHATSCDHTVIHHQRPLPISTLSLQSLHDSAQIHGDLIPPQSPTSISLHVNVPLAKRPRNDSSPLTMVSGSVPTFSSQVQQPEMNIISFSQSEVFRQSPIIKHSSIGSSQLVSSMPPCSIAGRGHCSNQARLEYAVSQSHQPEVTLSAPSWTRDSRHCQPRKYSLAGPSQMQSRPILPSCIASNTTHVTYSSAKSHDLSLSQHHLSRRSPQPVSSQHLPQQHSPAHSSRPLQGTYTIPPTSSDVGMMDCHASPSHELSMSQSSRSAVNLPLTPGHDFIHNTSSVAALHVPYGPHSSFIPHGGSIPAVSEFLPQSSHVTTHQPAMNSQYQEPTLAGTSYGAQPISLPLSGSATTSFERNYSVSGQTMPHHFYPHPSGLQLPQLAGCNTFTPQQYQYAWSALNNAVLQHRPMTPFGYSQPGVATNYHQPVQQLSHGWMQPPHQQQVTTPSHPATSPSATFTTNSFPWTSTPTTSNY